MPSQKIILGDCLDVLQSLEFKPEAIVSDPPANIAFMGRSWDRAHPCPDYVLPCVPRSKAHERELRSEESFIKYWAVRYSAAYDACTEDATALIWTLPRTSYQTASALRRAGWTIKDNLVHLFGTGWMKSKREDEFGNRVPNALAPSQEGWLLAIKGKPELDIDACRVPRGAGDVSLKPNKFSPNQHAGWSRPWNDDPNAVEAANERSRESQAKTQAIGSIPKNALLSHCEDCVCVGSRAVNGTSAKDNRGKPGHYKLMSSSGKGGSTRDDVWEGFGDTESIPVFRCIAGCVCGARAAWPDDRPLPRCPCGEAWRWLCPVAALNEQSGESSSSDNVRRNAVHGGVSRNKTDAYETTGHSDQGGAARFFNSFQYLPKCSPSERHAGCENLFWRADKSNPFGFTRISKEEWESLEERKLSPSQNVPRTALRGSTQDDNRARGNVHPTVKSYRLMHWLHALTGAKRIVDICAGSGTGMITAAIDGIDWVGAEVCPEAVEIARARHAFWSALSPAMLREFMAENVVPQSEASPAGQLGLFGA